MKIPGDTPHAHKERGCSLGGREVSEESVSLWEREMSSEVFVSDGDAKKLNPLVRGLGIAMDRISFSWSSVSSIARIGGESGA